MSKKQLLAIILLVAAIAAAIYYLNWIPQYTNLVNWAKTMVVNGWNANPWGIGGAAITTFTGAVAVARAAWNRTKTTLEGTYNSILAQKDETIEAYQTLEQEFNEVKGALTARTSEVETYKTTISKLQQKLADATAELQRKQDEYNAALRIKAIAEALPTPTTAVH